MRLLSLLLGLCIAVLLTVNSSAEAACSGSGTTWNCTAGTTATDVSSTLSSASDGATLTFAAGSYSWTSGINFSMSKGVTLVCASAGGCTVTGSGLIGMNGSCSGTSTKLYRVSGFVFSGRGTSLWFYGPSACKLSNVRIDHNTFTSPPSGSTLMYFGENSSVDNFIYGVADHNTVNSSGSINFSQCLNGDNNNPPVGTLGSDKNFFYEDNTFNISAITNNGVGLTDTWGGCSQVFRYNKVYNNRIIVHGSAHAWGPINTEVYKNYVEINNASDGYVQYGNRLVHHQGSGTYMIFDNAFRATAGQTGGPVVVQHSGSQYSRGNDTICNGTASIDGNRSPSNIYYGYPCYRGPGRDMDRTLSPMYAWQNRWNNTGGIVTLDCQNYASFTCTAHVVENRDYYNAVSASAQTSPASPFNGTIGVGFGTLANRPATCTTGSETGGGVGYFATDQGARGTLYRCSAANTWVTHYTPYTYPHPLVAGGTGGGAISPPPAPANLTVQ